jgi:hypothetical protein
MEALAKARGVQAARTAAWIADLTPVIKEIQAAGTVTLSSITRELNARGIRAPRGGRWRSQQLWPVLSRLSLLLTARQSRQISFEAKLAWMSELSPAIAQIQSCGHKTSLALGLSATCNCSDVSRRAPRSVLSNGFKNTESRSQCGSCN